MTVITEPGRYELSAESAERRIPVNGGYVAIVDEADYDSLSSHRWHALRGHNGKIYAHASITAGSVYMHRLVAKTPAGYETDHINGDGLDNRRTNLRPATASQNRANMWKPKRPDGAPSSSIFKGVSWDKSRGKWQSKIQAAGRCKNLGRFTSEVDAARAYDAAALAEWGEFAMLNFPVEVAS